MNDGVIKILTTNVLLEVSNLSRNFVYLKTNTALYDEISSFFQKKNDCFIYWIAGNIELEITFFSNLHFYIYKFHLHFKKI